MKVWVGLHDSTQLEWALPTPARRSALAFRSFPTLYSCTQMHARCITVTWLSSVPACDHTTIFDQTKDYPINTSPYSIREASMSISWADFWQRTIHLRDYGLFVWRVLRVEIPQWEICGSNQGLSHQYQSILYTIQPRYVSFTIKIYVYTPDIITVQL